MFDTELINITLEEDFKPKGMYRCKDAFLNILSDIEDNEVEHDEENDKTHEDEEGFRLEEESMTQQEPVT